MIPYGRQCIEEDDIEAVVAALRGDFLTTGPKIAEFETTLCEKTGAKYAVACSNGTTALHLAALALGLKEGDAVIVPSITFLATANAVRYCGAEVVFSDVDPDTGLMTADHLREALTRCGELKQKAVFPVHLAGQCVDMESLSNVAKETGLHIVTDAAHAIGSVCGGSPVGACQHEDLTTFSFHPVKTIAMGEGGAVTTNNPDYAEKMRRLRSHGMERRDDVSPWMYEMNEVGFNYRVTDFQCALGLSQLKKIDRFVARRRELVARYDALLKQLSPIVLPPQKIANCNPAWHLYAVRIDFQKLGTTRAHVINVLKNKGIGTQVHYIPVHTQPYYKKRYGDYALHGATQYFEKTLSLPLFPAMKDMDVDLVVEALKDIVEGKTNDAIAAKTGVVR